MRNASRFGQCCVFALMAAAVLVSQPAAAVQSHQAQQATFSASDYRFEGPDRIPAGQTTVRLRNRGKEPHQLQLLKLDDGKSPADLSRHRSCHR